MLFSTATYSERRSRLRQLVGSGVIVLLGNNDSPCNFPNNPYKFRQDSSFLYFTGQHRDGLALVIDCESGAETLVGNDIDIDDVILDWSCAFCGRHGSRKRHFTHSSHGCAAKRV